jgi:hypothetical protein
MIKQEAIEPIRMAIAHVEWEYPMDYAAAFDMAVEALSLPEVIRCKECKHGEPCNEGDVFCTKDIGTIESSVHKSEWFCADGERRDVE